MNVSKNHAVWARCHLAGEASEMDCTIMSSRLETSVSRPDHFSTFCPTNEGSGNFARGIFVFRWSNVLWPNAGRRRFAGFVRIPSMRREYVELETAPPFDGFRSSGSHLDAVARRPCPGPH